MRAGGCTDEGTGSWADATKGSHGLTRLDLRRAPGGIGRHRRGKRLQLREQRVDQTLHRLRRFGNAFEQASLLGLPGLKTLLT